MTVEAIIFPHVITMVYPGSGDLLPRHAELLQVMAAAARPVWVEQLFRLLLGLAAIVFLGVEVVLVYAVLRFRRRPEDGAEAGINPRPGLELVWTLIPAILVIVIAIFSFRALSARLAPTGGGSAPPASSDASAEGHHVFMTYGCAACHTLGAAGATGTVGPSLDGVGRWAGEVVPGMDAEAFLTQSILDPGTYVAGGYEAGIMPTNFAARLSQDQLSALVMFLLAQH